LTKSTYSTAVPKSKSDSSRVCADWCHRSCMRCHSPVIDPSVPVSHVCLNCMRDAEKSRPDSHLDHATPTFVPTQTVRGKATYSAITHWHGSSKRYESEGRNSLLLNAANIQILTFMQQTDTVQESRASQAPSAQQPFMLQSSCSQSINQSICLMSWGATGTQQT